MKLRNIYILIIISSIILYYLKAINGKKTIITNINKSEKLIINDLKSCPKRINNIPKNSTLIVGHAYGSHLDSDKRGNIGIAPKVKEFYLRNKKNIDLIIFSGDVLKEPSIKKWEDLYSDLKKNNGIFIAPGNHDVDGVYYDSARRDVFNIMNHKNLKEKRFPLKFSSEKSFFIIGDSNSRDNQLNEIYSIIKKNLTYENIFVIMHHVYLESLSFAANAPGKHGYFKESFFIEELKKIDHKNIIFIYGDGGAFKKLPRIACKKLINSTHIVNGIGEVKGDIVLIVNNGEIYSIEI